MALIKSKDFKGITCEYWKIISATEDYKTGNTNVILGLYENLDARTASVGNFVKREVIQVTGTDLTRADMYAKIVESNIVEEVEQNWFADAVNDEEN